MKSAPALAAALAATLATAYQPNPSLDASILKNAGFPPCAIPCILEAKRQSDCGPDIRCQCTTGWNKIHDSVKECLTATTPCSEANDGAKVKKAGLAICSSFGVKNVGTNSTASMTTADATPTTTQSLTGSAGSKSTNKAATKGSAAVSAARPGLLELGLIGLAGAMVF